MDRAQTNALLRNNLQLAKCMYPEVPKAVLLALRGLTNSFQWSLSRGDLIFLKGAWYVIHTGLLGMSQRQRCSGIHTSLLERLSDPSQSRWIFKATVFKSTKCKGYVGYGDADPSNVSPLVRGAEMRVAETRAVNRALRKAYGIGICSVEELGSGLDEVSGRPKIPPQSTNGNGFHSHPKLRDRLLQLIRQHQLDPVLVKAYAVEFCGAKTLRDASREQVENFIQHLADWAEKDKNALLCQLNSYLQPEQGNGRGAA